LGSGFWVSGSGKRLGKIHPGGCLRHTNRTPRRRPAGRQG